MKKLKIIIFVLIVVILLVIAIFGQYCKEKLIKNDIYDNYNTKIDLNENLEEQQKVYEDIRKANQESKKIKESNSNEMSEGEKKEFKEKMNELELEIKELLPN